MSALVFLALAVVISVIGTFVLWVRSRQPNSPDASIDAFNAKLRALSGEDQRIRDSEGDKRREN